VSWLVKFVTTEEPSELVERLSKDEAVSAVEVVERDDVDRTTGPRRSEHDGVPGASGWSSERRGER
jgi:DNA invertase Pin-like site-specific DNA recombinase